MAIADVFSEIAVRWDFEQARRASAAGRWDEAFRRWARAHRRLARREPFSRAAWAKFVDDSILYMSADRLRNGLCSEIRDETPVFVVGLPRTGTTLTERILSVHPDVHGAGERTTLEKQERRFGDMRRAARADEATLTEASISYGVELRALSLRRFVVDKMPDNWTRIGLISLLLPGARIIWCTRDSRDVGFSIWTYRFFGRHPYAHDLGDLGWYIRQHDRLMAHWRVACPNPILVLPLSDWLSGFRATLRRVLGFLDLPYDPRCEDYRRLAAPAGTVSRDQVRQPLDPGRIGRWRPHEKYLGPLLRELG